MGLLDKVVALFDRVVAVLDRVVTMLGDLEFSGLVAFWQQLLVVEAVKFLVVIELGKLVTLLDSMEAVLGRVLTVLVKLVSWCISF